MKILSGDGSTRGYVTKATVISSLEKGILELKAKLKDLIDPLVMRIKTPVT